MNTPSALSDLKPAEYNPRKIDDKAFGGLKESLTEFGDISGITFNSRTGNLVSGHQRVKALMEKYGDMKIDGNKITTPDGSVFAVRVVDWDDTKEKAANLAANNPAIGGQFTERTFQILDDIRAPLGDLYGRLLLDDIRSIAPEPPPPEDVDAEPQIDRAAELNKKWQVKTGDLWLCGNHRLLCGDSTKAADVARVMGGAAVHAFITDPPYCSGGFQEAGRATGSIGTKRKGADGREFTPRIANDALSSRGYCALMKAVIGLWNPSFAYMFTDWRMWVQLFDVMESSGYGVRNMIVWDKGSPGMGRGWRSQHELVMFGAKDKPEFDNHEAVGNVLRSNRTGNPDHPTQKPVDVIETIMRVTVFCANIADPFLGSGTTMVAAQNLRRRCFGIEISPAYCAVILERMKTAFPEIKIEKIEDETGNTPVMVE